MDLFKYNTTDPTVLTSGQRINGAKSKMWVERYLDPGEFEIQAPLSTGLREFLPLGTLISHVDTMEVMIVENHKILDDNHDPTLSISGRDFATYLENRPIGLSSARTGNTIFEQSLGADYTSQQAASLINVAIAATSDANDRLTNVIGQTDITTISGGPVEERPLQLGTVYERLRDILKIDDLGVRTIRRNPFGIGTGAATQTLLNVFAGVDRTKTVQFSWYSGDFDKIEYLFSMKPLKTSAMVVSKYCWTVVDTGPFKYDRRVMLVNAKDLDEQLNAAPTAGALTTLLGKMATRGRQALKSQQQVTISSADISNVAKYTFRQDYNLGDLVKLDGNYGTILTMRVIEYAEIEDENGISGHPTLAVPGT